VLLNALGPVLSSFVGAQNPSEEHVYLAREAHAHIDRQLVEAGRESRDQDKQESRQ
jgi:hypothetical protein